MKAYHGNQDTKDKYVQRMKAHMTADELIRGTGFENGKGCAVGCTLNKYDHWSFVTELGIPSWLAYLLDTLHENTSDTVWPTYSLRFLETIKPGVDLEAVKAPFVIFILRYCKKTVGTFSISNKLKQNITEALNGSIKLYEQPINTAAAVAARAYADSAAARVDTASAYAGGVGADSDVSGDAYTYAGRAARTASYAAGGGAIGARAAARVALYGADTDAACDLFAEKLIELIGECKVQH